MRPSLRNMAVEPRTAENVRRWTDDMYVVAHAPRFLQTTSVASLRRTAHREYNAYRRVKNASGALVHSGSARDVTMLLGELLKAYITRRYGPMLYIEAEAARRASTNFREMWDSEVTVWQRMENVKVLCIDGLGAENTTDKNWIASLRYLITNRFNNNRITLLGFPSAVKTLGSLYGDAFSDTMEYAQLFLLEAGSDG